IGLAIFIAVFQTLAYKNKDPRFDRLARFFGNLFLVNFATGVVTGIVQEFQFGMNWSGYSRFVGDIFGAPLAIEALAAFFLESTFLGLWIFGRNKIKPGIHLLSIWLVALGSTLSAYWILVANSFMQQPEGFAISNGRAVMTDFFAVIGNTHVLLQFTHVVTAALSTAAIFVVSLSAYKLLKKRDVEAFSKSLKFGAIIGFVSVILVAGIGDAQGKYLVQNQPMKMAAAEALWETSEPAALSLFSIIDEKTQENKFEIAVPNMLSFLSYGNFTGKVTGIKELQAEYEKELGQGNYIPPVTVSFWSFRVMVGLGMLMLLVLFIALLYIRKSRYLDKKWLLTILFFMLPAPYLCNITGWVLTEIGRQPWLVYKVLRLEDGISKSVSPGYVLVSLIGFTLIYAILAIIDIAVMTKFVRTEGKEA
ncbi:MAG: cytochrome ubiquinol oxidase subunit I, partial [Clostridiales bacterium]|nr:cytochrome ubiquinol oxidase subunit I [Clostridiales bacterium]